MPSPGPSLAASYRPPSHSTSGDTFIASGWLIHTTALTCHLPLPIPQVRFSVITGKGAQGDVRYDMDNQRLRQILVNMLSNALKFTKSGSVTFAVSATNRGDHDVLLFEVTDTGHGMNPDVIKNIFPVSNGETKTQSHVTR